MLLAKEGKSEWKKTCVDNQTTSLNHALSLELSTSFDVAILGSVAHRRAVKCFYRRTSKHFKYYTRFRYDHWDIWKHCLNIRKHFAKYKTMDFEGIHINVKIYINNSGNNQWNNISFNKWWTTTTFSTTPPTNEILPKNEKIMFVV